MTGLLGAIRKRLAWALMPGITKEEAKRRFRLMEPGTFADSTDDERWEAFHQIRELQRQLGINYTHRPSPATVKEDGRTSLLQEADDE